MISLLQTSVASAAPFCTYGPSGTVGTCKYVVRANTGLARAYPFPAKARHAGRSGIPGVPVMICRAGERQPSATDFIMMLTKASSVWDKYDNDRNGTMSLKSPTSRERTRTQAARCHELNS
ncbi:hypothetical protein Vretimale_131 [Volvox reticuliferus]|uniref:Uncharacterized protein n=1 Tax=Volvox reticuliferus TaxID=1737510 RepID=A0A8J4FP94_9CHLO|nr:hypothetical protein Vretifemale_8268 [Volvox reticuliferus]GIL93906.1 hypothetical protein Vretimale_131 [Volvox reticuliferus]